MAVFVRNFAGKSKAFEEVRPTMKNEGKVQKAAKIVKKNEQAR